MLMTGPHGNWLGSAHPLLLSDAGSDGRTVIWVKAALLRGERVICTTSGNGLPEEVAAALSTPARWSPLPGQVQVVQAADCRAATGGSAEGLGQWFGDLVDQARRDGYRQVALTGDAAAWAAAARDEGELVKHEEELERLATEPGVRVLCRYPAHGRAPDLLDQLLRVHHRHVDDSTWGADVVGDRVHLVGEIDAVNAGLVTQVLLAAAAGGIDTVDLTRTRLISAAGLSALVRTAAALQARGGRLTLVNPAGLVRRILGIGGLGDHPGIDVVHEEWHEE